MTTTTNSQAASIDTDPYFCKLLSRIAEFGFTGEHDNALIAYIDAKLAQARKEGYCEGSTVGFKGAEYFYKERATAAESRLAEIQRGVEGLPIGSISVDGLEVDVVGRNSVLALLQPQGQASTCEHNIVSAVNQIVKSGMLCTKCGKLFHDDGTPIQSDTSGLPG